MLKNPICLVGRVELHIDRHISHNCIAYEYLMTYFASFSETALESGDTCTATDAVVLVVELVNSLDAVVVGIRVMILCLAASEISSES